jgi:hypothetical protein
MPIFFDKDAVFCCVFVDGTSTGARIAERLVFWWTCGGCLLGKGFGDRGWMVWGCGMVFGWPSNALWSSEP